MNIAFYGSSLLSSYWNGAATYYRGLLRALAAYGHASRSMSPTSWTAKAIATSRHPTGARSWCILPRMTDCAPR